MPVRWRHGAPGCRLGAGLASGWGRTWWSGWCWTSASWNTRLGRDRDKLVPFLKRWGLDKMAAILQMIFFLVENVWISIEISLNFVPTGPTNNIPALVQIMAWRQTGPKPLFEPIVVSLLKHKCVTRPQWVKKHFFKHVTSSILYMLIESLSHVFL